MIHQGQVSVTLPADLFEQLTKEGAAMGMNLPAYLKFLQHARTQAIDARAQDAVRYMFTKHADSLKKLAQ
ncbi:MAG: hypothetical protein IT434_04150 [Phycisphaerales bacterium]|jgi:hypothetical protein|nr:hypothetical protein [Phycisphaerales bacterium]